MERCTAVNIDIEFLQRVMFIIIFLSCLSGHPCQAKLYNSESSFKDMLLDSEWKWNGTSWNVSANGFLTSGSVGNGGSVNFSTEVCGPCNIEFEYKKIGDAKLKAYYDKDYDSANSANCTKWNWERKIIPVPPGGHTVTWDLKAGPCEGIACSAADFKYINIPDACGSRCFEPDFTIIAPTRVCINSINIASVPAQEGANYLWNVTGGKIAPGDERKNSISWAAGDSSQAILNIKVIRNGRTNEETYHVYINQQCYYVRPPGENLQSIINNSTNKTLFLEDGVYDAPNYPILIDNINNMTIKHIDSIGYAELGRVGGNCNIGINPCAFGINNSSKIILHGLNISICSLGVYIRKSNNCTIQNNNIAFYNSFSNGSGIYLDNSSLNRIDNNYIEYIGTGDKNNTGIALYYSDNNSIDANHIRLPKEKIVINLEKSCNNSIIYYIKEGHIYENDVECNETWNTCASMPCKSCIGSLNSCNNTWAFL